MKNIGGQAVIEGVMMKSPDGWSVAVRNPQGEINFKTVKTKKRGVIYKLPFLRGIFSLGIALSVGIKALEFSGSIAYHDGKENKSMSGFAMVLTIIFAFILAIGIFKFLPLFLTTLINNHIFELSSNSFLFNFIDGIIRVVIFFFYILLIGLWKDMKRVYEYHGAEHKVIYAYEAGEELSIENAKRYKPYHPRCGTSFLLIVMCVSILVFMIIPKDWSFLEKFLSRVFLIPFIAGISYEVLRFSAKMKDNFIVQAIVFPGLMLQRLTVREPDDSQIEVAIAAMNEVLNLSKDR